MPKVGGEWPNECERAAARADTPGPGTDEWGAVPARGVKLPDNCEDVPVWLGVGIWGTRGVPTGLCEGTGEANRAVEAARGTGLPDSLPLKDPGEDDIGTARGAADGSPSFEVDIVLLEIGFCDGAVVGQVGSLLSHLCQKQSHLHKSRQPQRCVRYKVA